MQTVIDEQVKQFDKVLLHNKQFPFCLIEVIMQGQLLLTNYRFKLVSHVRHEIFVLLLQVIQVE